MMTLRISLGFLLLCFTGLAPAGAGVLVGQKVPNFERLSLDGKKLIIGDQKPKLVVLEWFNPECPAVVDRYKDDNIPKLQKFAKENGVVWWSINSASADSAGDYSDEKLTAWFEANKGCPSGVIRDLDGSLLDQFGPERTPGFVIVDAQGFVAYLGALDNREDIIIPPTTHQDYVKDAIEGLLRFKYPVVLSSSPAGCPIER